MSGILDKKAKKGTCPYCHYKDKWRFFVGYVGDYRYGVCDRVNSCPSHGTMYYPDRTEKQLEIAALRPRKLIYLDSNICFNGIKNHGSNFHKYCASIGISMEHLTKWNIGTEVDMTVFYFRNKEGLWMNKKKGRYDIHGNRDKDFGFYSLKAPDDERYYGLCLFGEHLMSDKDVWIVESEKTAVIASWHYPQFDWVGCGSASGLSDGNGETNDKISVLKDKKVVWLCDADIAGRSNSSLRNLERHKINHRVVDLFNDRDDGYDIADAIQDNIIPKLK